MNNPILTAQSTKTAGARGSMLPPYAPLVMPTQILESDTSSLNVVTVLLGALLSAFKPSFRGAN